jgi:hypothetical protein
MTQSLSVGHTTLPCTEIAVGHCVIVNHIEQPCGRLLAVITAIEGDTVRCKYLNAESDLSAYNKRGGMSPGCDMVTPVGWFGVEVRCERSNESGEVLYSCVRLKSSIAKYRDGKVRSWQEHGYPNRYVARQDILRVAIQAKTATDVAPVERSEHASET